MISEYPKEKRELDVLELRMFNSKVQASTAIYKRVAQLVDNEIAVKGEIIDLRKSPRSIEEIFITYFFSSMLAGLAGGIPSAVLSYFAKLKSAKETEIDQAEILYEEMEKIKARLPFFVKNFINAIMRELTKEENSDLKFELKAYSPRESDEMNQPITLTISDAFVANVLPSIANSIPVKGSGFKIRLITTGQFGYIKDKTNTRAGMVIASSFLENKGKQRLEELSFKEAEELIDLLRTDNT
jgi:hypothetical protein